MIQFKHIKIQIEKGLSLVLAIIFSLISSSILFAYILNVYQKELNLDFEIAQTKALYNAESGLALGAYKKMYLKDYYPSNLDSLEYVSINNMGHYSVGIHEGQISGRPNRTAYATGHAYV